MKLIIWIEGLAGAGKSTTAKLLTQKLDELIKQKVLSTKAVISIDGDDYRSFTKNGYDKESRIKGIEPKMHLCAMLAKQDFIVVCSSISLFKECYEQEKIICANAGVNLCEVYISCEQSELIKRDQKGLYSAALAGEIKDVVGVDIDFDEPNADVAINGCDDVEKNVEKIIKKVIEYENR